MRRRCQLLGVNRSTVYYEAAPLEMDDIDWLNAIRDAWERYPFYGYRRVTKELKSKGMQVNRKRRLTLSRKKLRIGCIDKGFHFLGIHNPPTRTEDNTNETHANDDSNDILCICALFKHPCLFAHEQGGDTKPFD